MIETYVVNPPNAVKFYRLYLKVKIRTEQTEFKLEVSGLCGNVI